MSSAARVELPFTHEDRVEACAMLRDGCSTEHVCKWFGCTAEQLARECPDFFDGASLAGGLRRQLRALLADGPKTNAELRIGTGECCGNIARAMNYLMSVGEATNLAERRGRGSVARYALTPQGLAVTKSSAALAHDGSLARSDRPSKRTGDENIQGTRP